MKLSRSISLSAVICAGLCAASFAGTANPLPWSQRVANAVILRWPAGHLAPAGAPSGSDQGLGTLLDGIQAVWMNTADPRYFEYIQDSVDDSLGASFDNSVRGPAASDRSTSTGPKSLRPADSIPLGRQLLLLYRVTQKPEYLNAATELYNRLQHPQPTQGDDLDASEPFAAEYAILSDHPEKLGGIARQFVLTEEHASSRHSARGMARSMRALVDTLDYYPPRDPARAQLLAILARQAEAVAHSQNPATGLWDQPANEAVANGSALPPPADCMLVYALARGVRRGYLPPRYIANAERAYRGILASSSGFIGHMPASGHAGAVGAFLLAGTEMENAQNAALGRGDTVVVDGWFNSQVRADAFGKVAEFHYKWGTEDMPGYSFFGHLFRLFGAQTTELDAEPTFANLKDAQVFVIASPDNLAKNPKAHFANAEDADQLARWVRAGGVLVIMENDTSFADLEHFNVISEKFGIHFNSVLRKHVIGTQWDMGKIVVDGNGPIFHHAHTLYMKDVCTISVSGPARPALIENGDIFMATARYGKGTVYANVDPWLYNEYTDGRKLPAEYDNLAGGKELVRWVLEQVPHAR